MNYFIVFVVCYFVAGLCLFAIPLAKRYHTRTHLISIGETIWLYIVTILILTWLWPLFFYDLYRKMK